VAGHIPYDIVPQNNTKANEARIQNYISDSFLNQVQSGIPVSANDPNALLLEHVARIRHDFDIDISLKTLGLNFQGYVFNLIAGQTAQIILPAKLPRGYIIINPGEISGFSSTVTFFPSAARAAGTFISTAFNVSGIDTVRAFLDVTANALPHTLVIDAQTQDPLTGNWATSQVDIFGGSAAIGTYYASLGALGVDRNIRLFATVGAGAGTVTFSVSGLLKGGIVTPSGSTVYIGNANVNTTIGYPMLPGSKEYFYLLDDVPLYAISPTEPVQVKVVHLQ
jgi:hypothetical protein